MKDILQLTKKRKSNEVPDTNKVEELIPKLYFKDGILCAGGNYIGFLEVMPVNFKLLSRREQNYIINQYGELLNSSKVKCRIFTIAKKADASSHIELMEKELQEEKNENVKIMIKEYINYVRETSYKTAVKRRWIIAIPYAEIAGVKSEFDDIKRWIRQKSISIKEGLSKCTNDCIISDSNEFTAEIVYQLLNIKTSERQSIIK